MPDPSLRVRTWVHDFVIAAVGIGVAISIGLLTLLPPVGAIAGALASTACHALWPSAKARDAEQEAVQLREQVASLSRRRDMSDPIARRDAERSMRARGWRS
jgi:hypothetical protein